MAGTYELRNWSMIMRGDDFTPPECRTQCLHGEVYHHGQFNNGEKVSTSRIVELNLAEGFAITASGSKYKLGKPREDFVQYLKDIGHEMYDQISKM